MLFKKKKKETVITVYDMYYHLVKGTEVELIESGTMKRLTFEESKDRKVSLIVPCGELKVNIFVERE